MGLHEEGKTQVDEASKILEQIGDVVGQARCLRTLAVLLESAEQLDAAEEAASRAINLFSENGNQFQVCQIHRLLGRIYRSKGETDKAIHNFEVSSGTASSFNWHNELVFVHFALAEPFLAENKLDDACTHVERVKSHAVNHTYHLGRAMRLQAKVWHKLHRLEEAKAEALRAANVFEELGAADDLKQCGELLQQVEEEMVKPDIPGESTDGSDPLVSNDDTVYPVVDSST